MVEMKQANPQQPLKSTRKHSWDVPDRKPWSIGKKIAVWGATSAIVLGVVGYQFYQKKLENDKVDAKAAGIVRLAPEITRESAQDIAELAIKHNLSDKAILDIARAIDTSGLGSKHGLTVKFVIATAIANKGMIAFGPRFNPDGTLRNSFKTPDSTNAANIKSTEAMNVITMTSDSTRAELMGMPAPAPPAPDTAKAPAKPDKGKKGKAPKVKGAAGAAILGISPPEVEA